MEKQTAGEIQKLILEGAIEAMKDAVRLGDERIADQCAKLIFALGVDAGRLSQ